MDDATVDIGADLTPLDRSLDLALSSFRAFGSKVKGVLSTVLIGSGIANIVGSISHGFSQGFSDLARKEQEITKLNVALKASGGVAGYTSEQLQKMADQLEKVTGFEAETAMGAQAALLQFKNIRGDVFSELLKLSADFAAQTGMDLPAAAEKWGLALNDPLTGFRKLAKEGVVFSQQQRDIAEQMIQNGDILGVQKVMLEGLANTFGGGATEKAKTWGGQLMILENIIGDVYEALTSSLTPTLVNLMPYLQLAGNYAIWAAEQWASWTDTITEFAGTLLDQVDPAIDFMVDVFVTGFSVIETIITDWKDVAVLALVSFELQVVKSFNQLVYFFSDVLPPLFDWFSKNWKNLLQDAYSFLGTVIYNMSQNLSKFFEAVWSWLSGDEFDFKWTSLLEGFESTISELPKIAERIPGELEKSLGKEADALGGAFKDKLAANIEANRQFADELMNGVEKDISKKKNPDIKPTDVKAPYTVNKEGKEDKGNAGSFEDLTALSKRIQGAAFKTPEEKELEDQTEIMKTQGKEQADAIAKLTEKTDESNDHLSDIAKSLNKENLGGFFV